MASADASPSLDPTLSSRGTESFRLCLCPSSQRTVAGENFYLTAALLREPGFEEPIVVEVLDSPGIQSTPLPAPSDRPTFRIHLDGSCEVGKRQLVVRATAGRRVREMSFPLDIALLVVRVAEPDALLAPSGSATVAVRVLRAPQLAGPVEFALRDLSAESRICASFLPPSTLGEAAFLRLKAGRFAPAAEHVVRILASCAGTTASAEFRVEVMGDHPSAP